MRILQINVTVNSGSHGRIAEEIGQAAIASGHGSYIAAAYTYRQSKSEVIKIGNDVDRRLHGLRTRLFDRHGFGSVKATRKLVNQISGLDPDIIHFHNIHGYFLHIGILFEYLKKADKPVIWTLHDCWPFTGHCAHFQFVNCDKWKSQCHHCPLTNGYPASWLIDNSRQNYLEKKEIFNGLNRMTIVSPSIWLAEHLKSSFLSHYDVKVINNGVNIEKFRPVEGTEIRGKYKLTSKYILGVANTWTTKKGLDDFKVLRSMLDPEIEIVLVGLGEKQLKSLPGGITGITRTENIDELTALYSGAAVFVNPTYVDNFPSVNIEALACSTPIISYGTGGSPEAIDDETGIIVSKGDLNGLLNAIRRSIQNGKSTYSEKCRKRAIEKFGLEKMTKKYLELYKEVMT